MPGHDSNDSNPESASSKSAWTLMSPGSIIGASYEIKSVIFQSPQSVVYVAHHTLMDKDFAIKVLNIHEDGSDERRRLRFKREVQIASGLQHPNIVGVIGCGHLDSGAPYIIMELVEGKPLRQRLMQHGRIDVDLFCELFTQVLSALDYAHHAGLIHRDIKPDNILLSSGVDNILLAQLTDFGISKPLDEERARQALTLAGELIGSPAYMSPEQCQNQQLDERSDLYSLGCVMYESLAGVPPFTSENEYDLLYKHVHEQARSLASLRQGIPPALCRIIEKCLQKDPAQRWSAANELKSALASTNLSEINQPRTGGRKLLFAALLLGVAMTVAAMNLNLSIKKTAAKKTIEHSGRRSFDDYEKARNSGDVKSTFEILDALRKDPLIKDKAHVEMCTSRTFQSLHDYQSALVHTKLAEQTVSIQSQHRKVYSQYGLHPYETARLSSAALLAKLGKHAESQSILAEQERSCKRLGDPELEFSLLATEAVILNYQGNYKEAVSLCKKTMARKDISKSERLEFLRQLALSLAFLHDDISVGKLAAPLAEASEDKERPKTDDVEVFLFDVEPFIISENWSAVRDYLKPCRTIMNPLAGQDSPNMATLLQYEAMMNLKMGELQSAQIKFKQAEDIQQRLGDKERLACELPLAYIAYKHGNKSLAVKYVEQALAWEETDWKCCNPALRSADVEVYLAEELKQDGRQKAANQLLNQTAALPQIDRNQLKHISELLAQ